jgi:hypothetical protein
MTTTFGTLLTRFRHYDDKTHEIYVGEIETDGDEITILSCWLFSTIVEQVYPYDNEFPAALRAEILQTAIEQRYDPPAVPIEIPDDWDAVTVIEAETVYDIRTYLELPTIASDYFREHFGFNAVRRIVPTTTNGYRVTVRGSFTDMMRELKQAASILMQDSGHAAQEREEIALIHI